MSEPAPATGTSTGRSPSPIDRLAAVAGGGPVLLQTARFGRSPVREEARRLRAKYRGFDLMPSWREYASIPNWGQRWPTEQHSFAAGLILSAAGDPVVERAVGRCLFDLAKLGRPLLWGVVNDRIRWHWRFRLVSNGWPIEIHPPPTATYARLSVAPGGADFCPEFDAILYAADADFFVSNSRLHWAFNPLWLRGLFG